MMRLNLLRKSWSFGIFSIALAISVLWVATRAVSAPSGPTKGTHIDVSADEYGLWNSRDIRMEPWNSTVSERASAPKVNYKGWLFKPSEENLQMERTIFELQIEDCLKEIGATQSCKTLLNNGKVLVSGIENHRDGTSEPTSKLIIIDPQTKTSRRLSGLKIPRSNHSVVQLDNRVIFVGGLTSKKFADDGTHYLTNTVEELDLATGQCKVIGRIAVPRRNSVVEVLTTQEIFIEGGWYESPFWGAIDWWPSAEIFRIQGGASTDTGATKVRKELN